MVVFKQKFKNLQIVKTPKAVSSRIILSKEYQVTMNIYKV